ncbi:hypothetical protein [Aeromonas veronii]|uniref:hypothetical protein n=1 Tax=Aeromonas veronii TaxID=654 RepID=UPI001F290F76|nr:hypothetical protein [Aeromonas veronii]MCF5912054.1 hypothetical protein [Aeromonas veronii]
MSALDPVILSEVNKVASAVAKGAASIIGMASQFPSTKPLLQLGSTEWLRSGVIAPRDNYPLVPDYLTLLGPSFGESDNGTLPAPVGIASVAVFGSLVVVSTTADTTYVSKDGGITLTLASGVQSQTVFEANGFIYASSGSNLRRTANGDTWQVCSGISSTLSGIAFKGGIYVATTIASESVSWVSTNGLAFTGYNITVLGSSAKNSVCAVNGFFLMGPSGSVAGPLISYDGVTWALVTLVAGSTLNVHCVLAAGDKAVAFTTLGIFETVDGFSWVKTGALQSGFNINSGYPKCFYSDGLIGILSSSDILLCNHLSSFSAYTFASGVPAAAISGGCLVGGSRTAGTMFYRRKLNRFVGSPKFVDGLYYRVK